MADILNGLCLPRHTDRLVYQRAGDNFEILAFDAVKDKSVEMLRWEVEEGKWRHTLLLLKFPVNQTETYLLWDQRAEKFKKTNIMHR